MEGNIQAWPTPEMFIRGYDTLFVTRFANNASFTLVTFFNGVILVGPTVNESGNARFALSSINDAGANVSPSNVADSSSVNFALSIITTITPVSGGTINELSDAAFALSNILTPFESDTNIADSNNALFALSTITA